jgi:NTP pyrophosphatase (non-canonical NTP hydrolase)
MAMTGKGLAKLIEECGELLRVAGKRLAYYTTDEHPDGGPPLAVRLEEEIADVIAAAKLVTQLHGLDAKRIAERSDAKLRTFLAWHARADNNHHGIDATKRQGGGT